MREPERPEAGVPSHPDLLDQGRDLRRHVNVFGILGVDEKPDLHGVPLGVEAILASVLNPDKMRATFLA
jgi:hypothetical protein